MVGNIQSPPPLITTSVEDLRLKDKASKNDDKSNSTKTPLKKVDFATANDNSVGAQKVNELKNADYSSLAKKLESIIGEKNLNFEFSLDKDTHKMIIKVINGDTKEVVQQYPPEVALKIARIVSGNMQSGQVTNAFA
jgi:uncharacterized FlaG/YvyC family protein